MNAWRGVGTGALYGLLLAVLSSFLAVGVLRRALGLSLGVQPALPLWGWTVLYTMAVGGLLSLAFPSFLHRRPSWFIHLQPLFSLPALVLVPETDRRLLLLLPLGLAHGLASLAWWAWRKYSPHPLWIFPPILGILPMGLSLPSAAPSTSPQPNVLWVILDTTRADHVSAYGYSRPTTPNFDALARQGSLFEHAYAPASWTLPSHASLLTGRYPRSHGCQDEHLWLDQEIPTLPEILRVAGYRTLLASSNPWVGSSTGLNRGFDEEIPTWSIANLVDWFAPLQFFRPWLRPDRGGRATTQAFAAFAAESGPFFALLNYMEAHMPYHESENPGFFLNPGETSQAMAVSRAYQYHLYRDPSEPSPDSEGTSQLMALYDAGIRINDAHLGRLLSTLEETGQRENTLIVVVGDHGESFGESGVWEHHVALTEEVLRVPLLLVWPRHIPEGRRYSQNVSLVDVMPTVLEALGRAPVPGVEGYPLFQQEEHPVFAEQYPAQGEVVRRREPAGRATAVQVGGDRLVREDGQERWWNREGTPTERPELRTLLDRFEAGSVLQDGKDFEVSGEARKQLEKLGYLETKP